MSLGRTFNIQGTDQTYPESRNRPKKKRVAPFSIRLSEHERTRLAMEAAGAPLGAYIKAKVLGTPSVRSRRTGLAVEDQTSLAQVLALLGRSRLASNINQLAWAVNTDSLPVTRETESELFAAMRDVREMRRLLLLAPGLKPEDSP